MSLSRSPIRNARMLRRRDRITPAFDAVKIALYVEGVVIATVIGIVASIVLGAV